MLLFSLRFNRKFRHSAALIALLLGVLAVGRVTMELSTAMSTSGQKDIKGTRIKNNEDMENFISTLGWEINKDSYESVEVVIPKKFDGVYEQYNTLQNEQKTDLKKYRGKTVTRYSYTVTNHPSGEKNVIINVLVYKNKVIGGDISSLGLDGFINCLLYPSTVVNNPASQ